MCDTTASTLDQVVDGYHISFLVTLEEDTLPGSS